MDRLSNTPITDAVYGKKAAHRKPPANKPVRKPRTTTLGEVLPASTATALVALRAELEAAQPKKRRRKPRPKKASS